jgi:6-phosphogluconolactonase
LLASLLAGAAVVARQSVADGQRGGKLVYIGTYTSDRSLGIYAFRFGAAAGSLEPLGIAAATPNPSFLAVSADGRFLFAVNELSDFGGARSGSVTSFAIDGQTGKLKELSVQASRGADPCHLALDRTGKFLAVANYTGGSVAVLPVGGDGVLAPAVSLIQHEGRGPNPERQEGPHAHQVLFSADNRFLIVADLGLDRLVVYRFDAASGALARHEPAGTSLPPGVGPRHVAFHPDGSRAYVINELSSTITSLRWDARAGAFRAGPSVSTLPPGFTGSNTTAGIKVHPGGGFLYGSNRGHDSVAVFSINPAGGLSLLETESSRGRTPRDFAIDETGRWLLAANQETGTLAVFRLDPSTGTLTPEGSLVNAGTPVCVLFAN